MIRRELSVPLVFSIGIFFLMNLWRGFFFLSVILNPITMIFSILVWFVIINVVLGIVKGLKEQPSKRPTYIAYSVGLALFLILVYPGRIINLVLLLPILFFIVVIYFLSRDSGSKLKNENKAVFVKVCFAFILLLVTISLLYGYLVKSLISNPTGKAIECEAQLGFMFFGDYFQSDRDICYASYKQVGNYMACYQSPAESICLRDVSIQQKSYLCDEASNYIEEIECFNFLMQHYYSEDLSELVEYEGIESVVEFESFELRDGDTFPGKPWIIVRDNQLFSGIKKCDDCEYEDYRTYSCYSRLVRSNTSELWETHYSSTSCYNTPSGVSVNITHFILK